MLDSFFIQFFLVLLNLNFLSSHVHFDFFPKIAIYDDVLVNADPQVVSNEAPQVLGQQVSNCMGNG
jgi:hypothetical protein